MQSVHTGDENSEAYEHDAEISEYTPTERIENNETEQNDLVLRRKGKCLIFDPSSANFVTNLVQPTSLGDYLASFSPDK